MNDIIIILGRMAHMLIGALFVKYAIVEFKDGSYFWFGAWLMAAVQAAAYIVKSVFTS